MTLRFNNTQVPVLEGSPLFGCIQMLRKPIDFTEVSQKIDKCKKCGTTKHFVIDSDSLQCPICNSDTVFDPRVVFYPKKTEAIDPLYVLFDVEVNFNAAETLLMQLCDEISEDRLVGLLFLSDKLIMTRTRHGLIEYDVTVTDVQPKSFEYLTVKEIKDIVLPSLATVFSLAPADASKPAEIFDCLKFVHSLHKKTSFTFIGFLKRQAPDLSVMDANYIGNLLKKNHASIAIGCTTDYRRLSAVARHTLGSVFPVSTIYPGYMKSILDRVLHRCSLKVSVPRYIDFTKVTGSEGSMFKNSKVCRLNLWRAVGCSISLSLDTDHSKIPNKFNLVEKTKTSEGSYVTVYSFTFGDSPSDTSITNTLLLKQFSSNMLRAIWEGEDYTNALASFKSTEINDLLKGSVFEYRTRNIQIDTLTLYYILLLYGTVNITPCLSHNGGFSILSALPMLYILNKGINYQDAVPDYNLPYDMKLLNEEDIYKVLCTRFGIDGTNCK